MGQLRTGPARLRARAATRPASALSRLDRLLQHDLRATAWRRPATRRRSRRRATLRFARAGHPPPVLVRRGRTRTCWTITPAPPLGACLRPVPRDGGRARAGDTILLYTDGLVERRGESLDGRPRAAAARGRRVGHARAGSASELVERLVAAGGGDDDIAILALRRRAGPGELQRALRRRPAVLAPMRRMLRRWLHAVGRRGRRHLRHHACLRRGVRQRRSSTPTLPARPPSSSRRVHADGLVTAHGPRHRPLAGSARRAIAAAA